jgi:hypothetical protein
MLVIPQVPLKLVLVQGWYCLNTYQPGKGPSILPLIHYTDQTNHHAQAYIPQTTLIDTY